jgi:hypothetical protein
MKNYVKGTLKPKMADRPDKQAGPSHDNDDGAGAVFPGEDNTVHMIWQDPQGGARSSSCEKS